MRKEEVPVLVIFIGCNIEFSGLGATMCVNCLALRVLLRNKSGGSESAKLQFGLDAKQCSTSSDERRASSHAHITGFYISYDFIFFTLVGKF